MVEPIRILASISFFFLSVPFVGATKWVDPETPFGAQHVFAMDGRMLSLVFSDEFNTPNREFQDGTDTRWTAEDRPAAVNAALHYYNSSQVRTKDGVLSIETIRQDSKWVEYNPDSGVRTSFERFYQSGMVTTWNKFCFTSGMVEISFQLPGDPNRGGLWPAFWMLGNLGRPNYLDSTNGVWPYSYDTCGISTEALDADRAQRISNCKNGGGRGSPEIDIIEAQPGDVKIPYPNLEFIDEIKNCTLSRPLMSLSLQVAPGISPLLRPYTSLFPKDNEWYSDLYPLGGEAYAEEEVNTCRLILNNYWYGQVIEEVPEVWQDGLSVNWQHDPSFYEQQTVIRMEWQSDKDTGYVRWFWGDKLLYQITSDTLKGRPGASDAVPRIPFEPMYLILNTDVTPRWGWNGCDPEDSCMKEAGICNEEFQLSCYDCLNVTCLQCPEFTSWFADFCKDLDPLNPASFEIDYIRVYQDLSDTAHTTGCDPPGYPTRDYINENWKAYTFNSWVKKEPLKLVQHGGGACISNADCILQGFLSNSSSACISGQCSCSDKWTGPHCHSPCVGEYATCPTNPDSLDDDEKFYGWVAPIVGVLAFLVLAWVVGYVDHFMCGKANPESDLEVGTASF